MKPRIRHLKPKAETLSALANQGPAIKTFLMCRPSFYGIEYEINPWMKLGAQADRALAIEQWDDLVARIREHGGDIRFVKEQPGLPDMVFTANGGLVFKDRKSVIISNFFHPERKGEEEWFVQWFADEGWQIDYPDVPFEGAGDALVLGNTLICGHGFRTHSSVYDGVGKVWGGKTVTVKLVNPHFYHLDTCFCPLQDGDYLIYPAAFDTESFQAIERVQKETKGSQGIVVPTDEAERFACNAVNIGRKVILPEGCPVTMQLLEQRGYEPVPVAMTEFIKSGGACKCLTLEIG